MTAKEESILWFEIAMNAFQYSRESKYEDLNTLQMGLCGQISKLNIDPVEEKILLRDLKLFFPSIPEWSAEHSNGSNRIIHPNSISPSAYWWDGTDKEVRVIASLFLSEILSSATKADINWIKFDEL